MAALNLLSVNTICEVAWPVRSTIRLVRMRCEMKLLFVIILLALTAWSQAPPASAPTPPQKPKVSPFAEYAGEWTATFDGKVWLRLHLELRGDQLIGAMLHARKLTSNDNGELKSVSEEQSGETITAAVLNPDGLLLTMKDPDSQETYRYMMRLAAPAKDAAELKMIAMSMPPGMPKPKPWRLVKTGVAPASKVSAPR